MFRFRRKVKLNHDAEKMNEVFGINEQRAIEIIGKLTIEWNQFLNTDGISISRVLENVLEIAKNRNEELYIAFLVGAVSEQYRLGLRLAEAMMENKDNDSVDKYDDRIFG